MLDASHSRLIGPHPPQPTIRQSPARHRARVRFLGIHFSRSSELAQGRLENWPFQEITLGPLASKEKDTDRIRFRDSLAQQSPTCRPAELQPECGSVGALRAVEKSSASQEVSLGNHRKVVSSTDKVADKLRPT